MRFDGHAAHRRDEKWGKKVLIEICRQQNTGKSWILLGEKHEIDLREMKMEGTNWASLTQDRDRWRVLANTKINLRVPQKTGGFLSS